VSHNRSRDGVLDKLDSRLLQNGSGMPVALMNLADTEGMDPAAQQVLPGATRADDGKRLSGRREIVVSAVRFSPTGREWAAATSDGLLVYSLAEDLLFW
jgi:periodic tryptophan protein 2